VIQGNGPLQMQAVRTRAAGTRQGTHVQKSEMRGTLTRPALATPWGAKQQGRPGARQPQGAINERAPPHRRRARCQGQQRSLLPPSWDSLSLATGVASASRPAGPGPAALLCGVRNLDVRQSGWFTAKPKRPAGDSALFTFSCELREGP
jgi:hypothetical protein